MRDAWSLRNNNKKAPENLSVGHLWLLPSDIHLSGAEIELSHKIGRETRLREALMPIIDQFDYIIIDTPPSLGLLQSMLCVLQIGSWFPSKQNIMHLKGSVC